MSQEVSSHYLILTFFVVILVAVDCIDEYDEVLNMGYRPIPPELVVELQNKTDFELKMEDCMAELITCMSNIGKKQTKICAQANQLEWKSFDTMCDMLYQNCKGYGSWHFLSDGDCADI